MKDPRLGLMGVSRNLAGSVCLAAALLVLQGCGPDMGPPPDQNARNNPVAPPDGLQARARRAGAPLKVKSIKDRS